MLGAIIGDIVGSTREWRNIKTEDFELVPNGSRFTDDTVMTLAVAEWLMADPEHRPETLVASMQRSGRKYPHAGYGGMFSRWLQSDHPQPYGSFGNGSAMRVSPVGLYASSLEEALRLARVTASVSHDHPEGIRGAQAIAGCVYLKKNTAYGEGDAIRHFVTQEIGYDLNFDLEKLRDGYGFDVTCQGSVPVAIKAYLERSMHSAEKALRLAISMGGDSDTIGDMTAAIAGAKRFDAIGGGFREELVAKCRALLPADLLDINDRFEAFVSRPLRQSCYAGRKLLAGEDPGDKPYHLERFLSAQELFYEDALQEITDGFKRRHWIWFIFPQLAVLGRSTNAKLYGISGYDEAVAYLAHPVLGTRLREMANALLLHRGQPATSILGDIDAAKVRSCMTLFDAVSPHDVFQDVLDAFYDGKADLKTLDCM